MVVKHLLKNLMDLIANLVIFLCSDKSDMIRGQTIVLDGGYSLIN